MDFKHLLITLPLLGALSATAQNQTASRMIGAATSIHNSTSFMLSDSSYMKYTNDRGGDLEHDMKFDLRHNLVYNPGTAGYANSGRIMQTFDAKSNLLTYIEENWDAPSSTWVKVVKYTNEFDTMNNMTSHIVQVWNVSTNSWYNISREMSTYNGDMYVDTMITQSWDGIANNWVNNTMMVTSYNLNNDPSIETTMWWDGIQWNNSSRTLYAYIDNREASRIMQYWDGAAWINSTRYMYERDTAGNALSEVYSSWNSFSNIWDNVSRYVYTYNTSNDMTEELYQNWNNFVGNWRNNTNSVYTYDTNHNNIVQIDQVWNNSTNFFQNTNRYTRTYNSVGQMTTQLQERWNSGGFWENQAGDAHNRYYYETYTLGVKNAVAALDADVKVYPVPANNSLNLELNFEKPEAFTVSVIDVTGKVMMQWGVQSTNTYRKAVNTSDIPAGNYFIKVRTTQGQLTRQFAVSH